MAGGKVQSDIYEKKEGAKRVWLKEGSKEQEMSRSKTERNHA